MGRHILCRCGYHCCRFKVDGIYRCSRCGEPNLLKTINELLPQLIAASLNRLSEEGKVC
jgi:hypothetical protein